MFFLRREEKRGGMDHPNGKGGIPCPR